jgi:hypothetical protein
VKVAFDTDEAWELTSFVLNRLAEEAKLSASDKAKLRRWRSDELRAGSDAMRVLTEKINRDLAEAIERKKRSQVRKPDWR